MTTDTVTISDISLDNILDDTVKIGGSGSSASPATRDLVQVENPEFG